MSNKQFVITNLAIGELVMSNTLRYITIIYSAVYTCMNMQEYASIKYLYLYKYRLADSFPIISRAGKCVKKT